MSEMNEVTIIFVRHPPHNKEVLSLSSKLRNLT